MTAPDNFSSSPILSLESAPYNGGGVLLNAYASTVASETRNDTSGSLVVTGVSQASIEGLQQYTTLDQARDGSAFLLINNELFKRKPCRNRRVASKHRRFAAIHDARPSARRFGLPAD
ncbi:hypothetical protein PSV3_00238 [Septimatrevirus PSV33]|uniref:Uncharacterized protein n=1 Tax=Pseudomonas phage PSV3 TaxID=3003632 RepID=A0AAE9VZJ7_9CAUD|nr:hypothetical protein PM406_gp39 [Pseudomonas phage PSV3]WBF76940.1 hypothetical protein PSV3_00238 [Pseudomonas phage PSV3]